jgi:hypothetical protein
MRLDVVVEVKVTQMLVRALCGSTEYFRSIAWNGRLGDVSFAFVYGATHNVEIDASCQDILKLDPN